MRARRGLRVCMVHCSDFVIDSRIQREAYALAERGDEVHSVCLSAPAELAVGPGMIRLHRVPTRKPRGGVADYLSGYARFFAGALKRVSALHRDKGLDLVEVHNMPNFLTLTALLPKVQGVPIILNVHDTFPELLASMFGLPMKHSLVTLMKQEERWSAHLADAVVTVTQEASDRLESRGLPREKAAVVMNSPDERAFGPPREPVAPPRSGPLRLVYHGGIAPRFGVESLIRGVGLLEGADLEVSLRVYGTGSETEQLRALGGEVADGRVWVAPSPTPFTEIAERLREGHVGVVPTLSDVFTELLLPVKLLEYVHMGLPVIASRLPVIERYFGDDEVLFYEPGSPEGLAEAIAEVRSHPEEAAARAGRAAQRLAEFRWEQQRQTYVSLVDRLTSRRMSRAA